MQLLKNIVPASPGWMQHKLGYSRNAFQQLHAQLAWNKPPLPAPLRQLTLLVTYPGQLWYAIDLLTTHVHSASRDHRLNIRDNPVAVIANLFT